jgi:hypothetical protein
MWLGKLAKVIMRRSRAAAAITTNCGDAVARILLEGHNTATGLCPESEIGPAPMADFDYKLAHSLACRGCSQNAPPRHARLWPQPIRQRLVSLAQSVASR